MIVCHLKARGRRAGRAARPCRSPAIRAGTALPAAVLLLLLCLAPVHPARAQDGEDSDFSFRQDEELFQLNEAVSMIAGSLNKVADRVSLLAINSVHFGTELRRDFREKARVIFLERLFDANPAIRLVKCQECERLQTKIVRGVLQLRKGIPSGQARRELAEELGVDGFIDIGVFSQRRQLTVYLQVFEAETGALILVEEVVGRRAPKRETLAFSFGEMVIPIEVGGTSTDHSALVLAVREAVQISERFSFGIELAFFMDNNENNPDPHIELDAGAILSPTFGYDVMQISSGDTRLTALLGLGKFISPQLNYGNLVRTGLMMIVGDELEVLFGYNFFQETDLESEGGQEVILGGTGYEVRFGYRF